MNEWKPFRFASNDMYFSCLHIHVSCVYGQKFHLTVVLFPVGSLPSLISQGKCTPSNILTLCQ